MRVLLVIGGVFALIVAVLFLRRREAQGLQPVGEIPDWAVPAVGDPKTSRNSLASYCDKIVGGYAYSVKAGGAYVKAPPYVTGGVVAVYQGVGAINCGAVKLIEKGVGAVIVTPAKKIWHAIF